MQILLFLVRFLVIGAVLVLVGAAFGALGIVEVALIAVLSAATAWLLGRRRRTSLRGT